jgi:hypothetical protein
MAALYHSYSRTCDNSQAIPELQFNRKFLTDIEGNNYALIIPQARRQYGSLLDRVGRQAQAHDCRGERVSLSTARTPKSGRIPAT